MNPSFRLGGFSFAGLVIYIQCKSEFGGAHLLKLATSLSVSAEHRFWLEILEDHAYFLLDRLSPREQEWTDAAARYVSSFAELRHKLHAMPHPLPASAPEWIAFAKEVHPSAAGYYKLEGQLQALLLAGRIQLKLPPTFLNSTLNENQEYLRLLRYYVQGADAPPLPLWNLMELWLDDQLGHAMLLQELSPLSTADRAFLQEAAAMGDEFRSHLIRNKAIQGYLRFTPAGFPAQIEFAREAAETVVRFFRLLNVVITRMKQSSTTCIFIQRFLEHQLPESSYFMRKLAAWIPDVPGLETGCLSKEGIAG
jgi:hypothetical protein